MSIFSVTNDALTIGVTYPVSLPFKTKQVMGLFFLLQTPCPRLVYARAQASLVFARKGRLRRGKEDLLFCRHPAMPLYVALPMRATTDSWQTTDSATTASYKSWFFFFVQITPFAYSCFNWMIAFVWMFFSHNWFKSKKPDADYHNIWVVDKVTKLHDIWQSSWKQHQILFRKQ